MAGIRSRLTAVFGVDLRSLAVLRIGLGIAVLLSIASYAQDFPDLIGEHGVLSLDVAASLAVPETRPFLIPFRLAPALCAPALLVALAVLGLALTLGFQTRLACAGCWIARTCLLVRNPFVSDYADEVLLHFLFWSIFLPLGARFSLDARRAGPPARSASPHLSVASVALVVQLASIYLLAGLKKSGPDWHQDGTAIWYVMQQHYWGTPLSLWLLDYPRLMELATWITPRFEVAIALALFVPFAAGVVRTLAVWLIVGFHLMLGAFITLAAAPFISGATALGLLPGAFWDRLAAWGMGVFADPPDASGETAGGRKAWWIAGQLALAVPVFLMLLSDFREIRNDTRPLPKPMHWLGATLRVTQSWKMYSPGAQHFDGWFVAPGELASGAIVDLLRGGERVRPQPPDTLPWAGDAYRMGSYREAVRNHTSLLGDDYGRWLCRAWNREHAETGSLARAGLVWMDIDLSHGMRGEPQRIWLVRHSCEEPQATNVPGADG